ncbi:DNA recombination protein RmuC [Salinisphaera dokdonensis]
MTTQAIVLIVFALMLGALVGTALAVLWARSGAAQLEAARDAAQREAESQAEMLADTRRGLDEARQALADARSENARLETRLEGERRNSEEKLKTLTEAREALTHQFKTLSQEILEEKSRAFTEQNKASLEPLINPLREHIGRFEKQVKEAYDSENRQRSALAEQVRLLEQSNKAIAEDATNLANALKGESKTQGNWGEMILETVLERSGLEKGTQYETQFASTTEDGNRQLPDAVVHLPEQRSIVIDSKVSLTAYLRVHEAEDEDTRRAALAEHLGSVRRHLKQLSAKNYQNIDAIRTLDYVFMFIPSEAAYVEALRGDFDLQREALDANIALVSPTTLMPMLRAIANLWRLQQQEENAAEIADKAGALYDKFVGFLDDLDKLGRAMDTANKAYEGARNKLVSGRGNIVRRSEQLKKMGANTSKSIGQSWQRNAALGASRGDADTSAAPEDDDEDGFIETDDSGDET